MTHFKYFCPQEEDVRSEGGVLPPFCVRLFESYPVWRVHLRQHDLFRSAACEGFMTSLPLLHQDVFLAVKYIFKKRKHLWNQSLLSETNHWNRPAFLGGNVPLLTARMFTVTLKRFCTCSFPSSVTQRPWRQHFSKLHLCTSLMPLISGPEGGKIRSQQSGDQRNLSHKHQLKARLAPQGIVIQFATDAHYRMNPVGLQVFFFFFLGPRLLWQPELTSAGVC